VPDGGSGSTLPIPIPMLAGTFSQSRISSFDPLSQVPLGVYQPTVAAPADAATRQALGGDLQPTLNLAGYVGQPVQLVTTLAALPALQNRDYFTGDLHENDPISVIRVRVAGVTGPDPVSLGRIRQVAQQISARTHLTADIVAGSSPVPTAIDLPAWIATRADPLASVRPSAVPAGRARHPRGITGLAVLNVARTPGRTLVGVIGLAVGVAALTLLVAISITFRGVVIGSLLGDAVAVQVRGVDYAAVTATVLLGVLAVADVMFLNIRERAGELATIRSFGWPERALSRLVVTEGALIGLAGAVIGAGAGLGAAAAFTGQLTPRLFLAAALAAVAGVLLTAAAAVPPAQLLRRLPAAQLLAED
jgi:hypothetical protein